MEKNGKTFIVTENGTGLDYRCAADIAGFNTHHHVIIACRNSRKGEETAGRIKTETENPHVYCLKMDPDFIGSVRDFYQAFSGACFPPLYAVVSDFNSAGYFLLVNLLLNLMPLYGRIIIVDEYIPFHGNRIKQTLPEKHNSLYFAFELMRRIRTRTHRKISVNVFNPGHLSGPVPAENSGLFHGILNRFIMPVSAFLTGRRGTAEKSGRILAETACGIRFAEAAGKYIDRNRITGSLKAYCRPETAAEIWEENIRLAGLEPEETIFSAEEHRTVPAGKNQTEMPDHYSSSRFLYISWFLPVPAASGK